MKCIAEYGRFTVGAQILLIVASLLLLAFWPADEGAMIAVPLTHQAAVKLLPSVLTGETTIVAKGPFEGSFVLQGKRDAIRAALRGQSTLVLAAPRSGCAGVRLVA